MFSGEVCGKAAEALNFYTSLFAQTNGSLPSKVETVTRFGGTEDPDKAGAIKYASFMLLGQQFIAMDSAHDGQSFFNEAISFLLPCDTQEEIDRLWAVLSIDPAAGQCGWLKDPFGVSWQITPGVLGRMLQDKGSGEARALPRLFSP